MDIPLHLQHRPTSSGLVVPVATPRTVDGRYLFGLLEDHRQRTLLIERRCQICGRPHGDRLILFARPVDLRQRCTSEPGLCPPCAAYSSRACPMLAGRLHQYRDRPRTDEPETPDSPDTARRRGHAADAWYAVWLDDYQVTPHPARPEVLAASWRHHPPRAIRPIFHSDPWSNV